MSNRNGVDNIPGLSLTDQLTIKNLEKILNDPKQTLETFDKILELITDKELLSERYTSNIYRVKGKDEDFILKELLENEKDVSALISKYIANKLGENYPKNLLKYYGNSKLSKNLSKKLDGDFSACAGMSSDNAEQCIIGNEVLTTGKPRVRNLAKKYKKLIRDLDILHELGVAHTDVKYDNLLRDGDEIYIADYDKVCRIKDIQAINQNVQSCSAEKMLLPTSYLPHSYYKDFKYKSEYDIYELAVTFYEIIMGKSFLESSEISTFLKNSQIYNQDNMDKIYSNKYNILVNDLTSILNDPSLDQDSRELLQFIIRTTDPKISSPSTGTQASTGTQVVSRTEKCDRNSKDPTIQLQCYETKSKKTGKSIIVPSYCDRILFNSKGDVTVTPIEYSSIYLNDDKYDSDHNGVYTMLKVQSKNIQQATGRTDTLNVFYMTLNQGDGHGDGVRGDTMELLEKFYKKIRNLDKQDIIILGLQEIQRLESIQDKNTSVPPFIKNLYQIIQFTHRLKFTKVYGMSKRKTGLFVFTSIEYNNIYKVTNPIDKCLRFFPEKLCPKSLLGVTVDFGLLSMNIYDTHLSFSQNSKDLGLSSRKKQLENVIQIIAERSNSQKNYINILGGDLNFRNSDKAVQPEQIITEFIKEIKNKNPKMNWEPIEGFKEPLTNGSYSFPPTCKYKTRKTKPELEISEPRLVQPVPPVIPVPVPQVSRDTMIPQQLPKNYPVTPQRVEQKKTPFQPPLEKVGPYSRTGYPPKQKDKKETNYVEMKGEPLPPKQEYDKMPQLRSDVIIEPRIMECKDDEFIEIINKEIKPRKEINIENIKTCQYTPLQKKYANLVNRAIVIGWNEMNQLEMNIKSQKEQIESLKENLKNVSKKSPESTMINLQIQEKEREILSLKKQIEDLEKACKDCQNINIQDIEEIPPPPPMPTKEIKPIPSSLSTVRGTAEQPTVIQKQTLMDALLKNIPPPSKELQEKLSERRKSVEEDDDDEWNE